MLEAIFFAEKKQSMSRPWLAGRFDMEAYKAGASKPMANPIVNIMLDAQSTDDFYTSPSQPTSIITNHHELYLTITNHHSSSLTRMNHHWSFFVGLWTAPCTGEWRKLGVHSSFVSIGKLILQLGPGSRLVSPWWNLMLQRCSWTVGYCCPHIWHLAVE